MSFKNPFKAHHGPKKSAISRTAEREFERESKKTEELDENIKKIYKTMKRCTECQAAQSKCEVKLTQNLLTGPLCREDEGLRHSVEQWSSAVKGLETSSEELNSTAQKTVMEPMKKLGSVFPVLQQSMRRRDHSLQEFNRCQAKVEKYSERDRTGPNMVKLDSSKKCRLSAKEDFDCQNQTLMEEMPAFYDGRIDYFQPSFQALIKSQIKYYTDVHENYTGLLHVFSNAKEEDRDDEEFMQNMQQKLAEIRSLSVTLDDR